MFNPTDIMPQIFPAYPVGSQPTAAPIISWKDNVALTILSAESRTLILSPFDLLIFSPFLWYSSYRFLVVSITVFTTSAISGWGLSSLGVSRSASLR
ncbi:hypothetical protein BDV37DRAFT_243344 [Aspergillus pseudonomiae]|uniref:Uncharacterized protein n=1 Tax=Aspergillus pseudonomiae TaxID=1506151 RepID=A0A5N7DIL1_9EURO|nr:uncharacterized protein BDV37DRAFT_243344 [Aspergillus pseudonomiae]KAE8406174.1 hypothetical protein BDV37DRAFT_243344 [Aspergillus pseudonomiae]